jgi:hypothetical protein
MAWIKLTHSTGIDYLNTDNIIRFTTPTATSLEIYDMSLASPATYTFLSSDDLKEVTAKLENILKVLDINQLANQIPG